MTVKIINANEASRNVTAVMTNDMKKIRPIPNTMIRT